jgi:Amt family ammonium transporter
MWGALATGIFADPAVNAAGKGLLFGNPKQLYVQAVSIVATILYTAVGTVIVVYVTKFITGGLRVDKEDEIIGLDNTLHGERAFEID